MLTTQSNLEQQLTAFLDGPLPSASYHSRSVEFSYSFAFDYFLRVLDLLPDEKRVPDLFSRALERWSDHDAHRNVDYRDLEQHAAKRSWQFVRSLCLDEFDRDESDAGVLFVENVDFSHVRNLEIAIPQFTGEQLHQLDSNSTLKNLKAISFLIKPDESVVAALANSRLLKHLDTLKGLGKSWRSLNRDANLREFSFEPFSEFLDHPEKEKAFSNLRAATVEMYVDMTVFEIPESENPRLLELKRKLDEENHHGGRAR